MLSLLSSGYCFQIMELPIQSYLVDKFALLIWYGWDFNPGDSHYWNWQDKISVIDSVEKTHLSVGLEKPQGLHVRCTSWWNKSEERQKIR